MEINLFPSKTSQAEITTKLKETINKAEALKGCVAFWVIGPRYLGKNFIELLNKDKSFYCFDIHKPTDLDSIQKFSKVEGVQELYIHLRKAGKSKDYPSLPKHLLHAKIMLFDLPNQEAEIWVGSHNFTDRALSGKNIEASTVIKCSRDSKYYRDVNSYLHEIKSICAKYNPDQLDIYKSIQNEEAESEQDGKIIYTIPINGKDIHELAGKTIMLLGDKESDIRSLGLGRVNQEVYIHAIDLMAGEEILFKALITSSGRINTSNELSYDMEFAERHYAIRKNFFFPYQSDQTKRLEKRDLGKFEYWANIQVEAPLLGFSIEPILKLKGRLWNWEKELMQKHEIKTQNKTVTYRAKIFDTAAEDKTGTTYQYPLISSINPSDRLKIRDYFEKYYEEFYGTKTYRSAELNLFDNPLSPELLKIFSRATLGQRMKLVKIKEAKGTIHNLSIFQ